MDEAARLIVGAGLLAGELVAKDAYKVAISVGGGMHHARPSRGAGFCIYNDVAICVRSLMEKFAIEKILILDTDGHAGDGTCEIFYDDPRILFISLHEDPVYQYPGTGFPHQIGEGKGKGLSVNIPLPSRTAIGPYLYALEEIFVPLAHEFSPDLILRNGGSDPHFADQLIKLGITVEGFQQIGKKVREVAESVCGGRIVDMVGSGYNATVLPYAWLALVSGVSGVEVKLKEPIPPPPWLDNNLGMEEVKRVVREVKRYLSPFWDSF
jgi:acetoin utilization protein AcuC